MEFVTPSTPFERVVLDNTMVRENWSFKHSRTHPDHQHVNLALSGNFLTPEAALKLVPFGITPLSDIVLDDEVESAGKEAPRAPHQDAAC